MKEWLVQNRTQRYWTVDTKGWPPLAERGHLKPPPLAPYRTDSGTTSLVMTYSGGAQAGRATGTSDFGTGGRQVRVEEYPHGGRTITNKS